MLISTVQERISLNTKRFYTNYTCISIYVTGWTTPMSDIPVLEQSHSYPPASSLQTPEPQMSAV